MTGQNPDPALQIKVRIEAAFNNVPYPGDDNIITSQRPEDKAIALIFKGVRWQDWKENPSQFLTMNCQTALFLMTDEAFHYYLPLYMIQALLDYEKADVIPSSIGSSFIEPYHPILQRWTKAHWAQAVDDFLTGSSGMRKYINGRYQIMNREQLRVILDFMQYIKRVYGPNYGWSPGEDRVLEKLEALLQA